ncbi:MAG: hypothetical protein H0X25_16610 [Acidobacteriales bacterium]|nr:hypothetical protein [Terriglobales bacterium]
MSAISAVSGISVNSPAQSLATRKDEFQKTFKQLGDDLQSGDLEAAKADFAQIQQLAGNKVPDRPGNKQIAQQLQQLQQDLQTGDLTSAQKSYDSVKSDLQARAAHHHHRPPVSQGADTSGPTDSVERGEPLGHGVEGSGRRERRSSGGEASCRDKGHAVYSEWPGEWVEFGVRVKLGLTISRGSRAPVPGRAAFRG